MSGSIGPSPIDLYVTYAANEPARAAAALKANPQASALAAYFTKVAHTITTPDALLKNYKVLTVVLGAFGLSGSIQDTAILRKLLTQNPTSKTSLAQTIGNVKYLTFANALSNWKTPPFATSAATTQIVSSYATNLFEHSADTQAPGLANALAFTRQAATLKSINAVQSDANLLAVTVTSLGLPLQNFEQLGFDQQTALLTSKLKISNLQSPAYVKRAAEQYIVAQQSAAAAGPPPGSTAALFSDTADTTGDTLLSILSPNSTDTSLTGGTGGGSGVVSLFA
jgi:hypothetical protein